MKVQDPTWGNPIGQSATHDENECKVCGGRKSACAVLGHRPSSDKTKWTKPVNPNAVRTLFGAEEGRFHLYLGDTFLGDFDHLTVTPLANALSAALQSGRRLTVDEVRGHEGKPVAAPCALNGCQFSTVSETPPTREQIIDGDPVAVPRKLVDFLLGISSLEGTDFGETHPTRAGKFWWRTLLGQCSGPVASTPSATRLKVRVRGPREDGRYDLTFGDEYCGSFTLADVTPLANALGHATGEYKREEECAECGGRASACRVLGHRPAGDKTEWRTTFVVETPPPAQQEATSTTGAVWCEHVGGLGPPFPYCKVCEANAQSDKEAKRLLKSWLALIRNPGACDVTGLAYTTAKYVGEMDEGPQRG